MNLIHRAVAEKDIPVICSWPKSEDELFYFFPKATYPLTPEQLSGVIAQRANSTVVELNGHPVAFANFYKWENGGTCSIGNVIVSSEVRNQGVAIFLMKQMCSIAFHEHKASEVTVSCFNFNTAGLLLYPKLGFQPFATEERQNKAGSRVALIHMRLTGLQPN